MSELQNVCTRMLPKNTTAVAEKRVDSAAPNQTHLGAQSHLRSFSGKKNRSRGITRSFKNIHLREERIFLAPVSCLRNRNSEGRNGSWRAPGRWTGYYKTFSSPNNSLISKPLVHQLLFLRAIKKLQVFVGEELASVKCLNKCNPVAIK